MLRFDGDFRAGRSLVMTESEGRRDAGAQQDADTGTIMGWCYNSCQILGDAPSEWLARGRARRAGTGIAGI